MIAYIDIDTIKQQLNIDLDYCDEDERLMRLADVAVRAIENHIDQPLENFVEDGLLDGPLEQAALMMITNMYENRSPITYGVAQKVALTYEYLLQPYVKLFDS